MTIETSGKKAIEAARAAEEDLIRDDIHAFLDQNEEASSQENMTPPMGEPKAAARPAAAPAEMISL